MLIKIEQVDAYNEWDSGKQEYRVSIEGRWEAWINPERITRVNFKVAFEGIAEIRCANERLQVTVAEANRIIDHINQTPAPAAPAPVAAPKTMTTKLLSMTRDETKNSRSPFWRCGTSEGFTVNVFKHDDPLKDNFKLFEAARYGPEMLAMNYGDTITWTRNPIAVDLVQNGQFWNVTFVTFRADGVLPDEPEPDDEAPEDGE